MPVAIDTAVLRIYTKLIDTASDLPDLDRTDLLCAATAVVYQAPMYTTKPDAYRPLRNGLRVLPYGKVRDRSAPPAPTEDGSGLTAVHALARAHRDGRPFDMSMEMALAQSLSAPEALAEVLIDILEDSDADRSWQIGLLESAQLLAPMVRASKQHDSLMSAASVLTLSGETSESRAALTAVGRWGVWPQDASDDILGDIEADPTDRASLIWYQVFLVMAGVPADVIRTEYEAVLAGTVQPSRARIDELSAAR
jgi:hypothetical protein